MTRQKREDLNENVPEHLKNWKDPFVPTICIIRARKTRLGSISGRWFGPKRSSEVAYFMAILRNGCQLDGTAGRFGRYCRLRWGATTPVHPEMAETARKLANAP